MYEVGIVKHITQKIIVVVVEADAVHANWELSFVYVRWRNAPIDLVVSKLK